MAVGQVLHHLQAILFFAGCKQELYMVIRIGSIGVVLLGEPCSIVIYCKQWIVKFVR